MNRSPSQQKVYQNLLSPGIFNTIMDMNPNVIDYIIELNFFYSLETERDHTDDIELIELYNTPMFNVRYIVSTIKNIFMSMGVFTFIDNMDLSDITKLYRMSTEYYNLPWDEQRESTMITLRQFTHDKSEQLVFDVTNTENVQELIALTSFKSLHLISFHLDNNIGVERYFRSVILLIQKVMYDYALFKIRNKNVGFEEGDEVKIELINSNVFSL